MDFITANAFTISAFICGVTLIFLVIRRTQKKRDSEH